jgi:cell division protein FtsL
MLRQQRTSASGGTKKFYNRLVTPQLVVSRLSIHHRHNQYLMLRAIMEDLHK